MAAGSDRRRADYSPNNRGFAMALYPRDLTSPWARRIAGLASRQLTTIRPPHISRSALAVCHWPAWFTSNLPEKCRIPECRKQIRPRRR